MRRIFRYLRDRRFKYEPLAEITLSESNLLHNFHTLQNACPKVFLAPVLKSNAYGHGLVQIAQILEKEKGKGPLVVDSYYEALTLRNEGIHSPILVIGYTLPANIYQSKLKDVAFTIHDMATLQELSAHLQSKRRFHLKIDTGMHRQGILEKEVKDAVDCIKKNSYIQIEGVCSHLADAETEDSPLTEKQIKAWNFVAGFMRLSFSKIKWFHLSASAGLAHTTKIDANMLRTGLSLYGIHGKNNQNMHLKPVLELSSLISSIKTIQAGEKVGYGGTFDAKDATIVATVPVGYFEGVDLRLSNYGFMKIGNSFAGVAGRVSMNITSLNVTGIPNLVSGQKVIVISSNKEDKNSVENIARICETIPYEILVHIPVGIRRTILH